MDTAPRIRSVGVLWISPCVSLATHPLSELQSPVQLDRETVLNFCSFT